MAAARPVDVPVAAAAVAVSNIFNSVDELADRIDTVLKPLIIGLMTYTRPKDQELLTSCDMVFDVSRFYIDKLSFLRHNNDNSDLLEIHKKIMEVAKPILEKCVHGEAILEKDAILLYDAAFSSAKPYLEKVINPDQIEKVDKVIRPILVALISKTKPTQEDCDTFYDVLSEIYIQKIQASNLPEAEIAIERQKIDAYRPIVIASLRGTKPTREELGALYDLTAGVGIRKMVFEVDSGIIRRQRDIERVQQRRRDYEAAHGRRGCSIQ
jgi:hypothetical protein